MISTQNSSLLQGVKIVSLALNAPGPVAAARLTQMGAEVTKVEPPGGDALSHAAPAWYERFVEGQTRRETGPKESCRARNSWTRCWRMPIYCWRRFGRRLCKRLGLDWESLHARHPQAVLCGNHRIPCRR